MAWEAHSTAVSRLASALLIVAALEFLALRVLLLSGPVLERGPAGQFLADVILLLGLTALSAGVLLALGLVAILCWRNLSTNSWSLILISAASATLALVLLLAVSPLRPSGSLLLPSMLLSLIVTTAVLTIPTRAASSRAFLVLISGALLAISAYHLGQVTGGMSGLPAGLSALHLGEILALATGVAALALLRRPLSRWAIIAGALAGLFLLAWLSAMPWLPATIAVWNFGLSMYLPAPVYPVVLGAFTLAVVQLFRQDARIAAAFLLIALGGFKWDVAYFNLLGIAGLLLLVDALRVTETFSPAARWSPTSRTVAARAATVKSESALLAGPATGDASTPRAPESPAA